MSLAQATAATPPRSAGTMSARRVSLIAALFVAVGPFAMALYTPAMPEVVEAFGTTNGMVKLTLTLYFAGFACAQLIAGPLSDAIGRRPVIIGFMGLFAAASVLALLAPGIETLMAARFLQGVGASAGVAISRAVVRDLFEGHDSSQIMNTIGIILALAPALAPTLGGVLVTLAGWRSIFAVMALVGLIVIAVTATGLRETVIADRSRLNLRELMRSYGVLAGNRHFMTASLTIAGSMGALYTQATILPFVLMQQLGLSPTGFGVAMLLQSGSFFVGALVVRQLMKRFSAHRLVVPGLGFIGAGSLLFLTLLLRTPDLIGVMGPVAVYTFGIAFVLPAMSTAALAPFPQIAGAASSLMGFLQMGAGLVMGSVAAAFADPLTALSVLIPILGATACLSYLSYRTRPLLAEPEPRRQPISGAPVGRALMPERNS